MAESPYNIELLEVARRRKGYSYGNIARRLDLSESTVHRNMNGTRSNPRTVRRIANILDVPMDELLPEKESQTRRRR